MASSPPCIHVEGFLYTAKNRLEFELDIPIQPPSLTAHVDQLTMFAHQRAQEFLVDLKHSYTVHCSEGCGKPATENYVQFCPRLHLPPKGQLWMGRPSPGPMLTLYVQAVCNMDGPCGQATRDMGAMAAAMQVSGGCPPENVHISKPEDEEQGVQYPKNGSCAGCYADAHKNKMLKCSRCKMVQYCKLSCQKADWSRHKKTCKWWTGARKAEGISLEGRNVKTIL